MQTFFEHARKLLNGHAENSITLQLLKSVKFYLARKRSRKCRISVYNLYVKIFSHF